MTLPSERIADHLAGRPIMVVGRAGMDIYPMPDGTRVEDAHELVNDVGGSSGNIAVSIAKQGHPVMLLSAVSNDGVGRFVTRSLGEYGGRNPALLRHHGAGAYFARHGRDHDRQSGCHHLPQ